MFEISDSNSHFRKRTAALNMASHVARRLMDKRRNKVNAAIFEKVRIGFICFNITLFPTGIMIHKII